MKKNAVKILSALLMLSMVFSSNVFAAEKTNSAWDSFVGLFSAKTATTAVGVEYRGHIENKGDFPLDGSWIQGPTELGTRGESLRMEGFWIRLTNKPADTSIKYNVHVQNEGWLFDENDTTNWANDGDFAGTVAKGQRIEAVKIVLVDAAGKASIDYDVMYQGHVQNVGDLPANGTWYSNGAQLGTVASSLRLEALKVKIVQKAASLTAYNAALAKVTKADYTTASWATYQAVVAANPAATTDLQSEVDSATATITAAQAQLVALPKVTSVVALNAKEVQITFNKAVLPSTVVAGGVNGAALTANVTAVVVGTAQATGALTGSLDTTKTVLTITATQFFKGQYVVGVTPAVTDAASNACAAYSNILTVADTTRPTISGPTYVLNDYATFTFSKPMPQTAAQLAAAMTVTKVEDGTVVPVIAANIAIATDAKSFTYNMSGLTAAKAYTISFIGLVDAAGNLQSPNPASFTAYRTTVDTTAPTVTGMTVVNDRNFVIQFSKELAAAPALAVTSSVANTLVATVDATDPTKYNVEVTVGFIPGVQTITVAAGYEDLNGNVGLAYAKILDLKADTTGPVYVSQQKMMIGADSYLTIKFNENVAIAGGVNALTGTYVDASSITHAFTPIVTADASQHLIAPATTTDTIKIKITGLAAGTYTATMPATLVEDLASIPNPAAAKTLTFTVGSVTDPTIPVPTVTDVQITDINQVVITFNADVSAATALNVANYAVDGQNVFEKAIFDGTAKIVVLTLKPSAFTVNGDRLLTIANVASTGGSVMDPFSSVETFIENVKPTIVSAVMTDEETITLTYNETVTVASVNTAFEYYIDGVKQAAVTNAAAAGTKTVTIAIPTVTDLTKLYQVKYVGTTLVDANGNLADTTGLVTVTQN